MPEIRAVYPNSVFLRAAVQGPPGAISSVPPTANVVRVVTGRAVMVRRSSATDLVKLIFFHQMSARCLSLLLFSAFIKKGQNDCRQLNNADVSQQLL